MLTELLLIAAGLGLLYAGGEGLVAGASRLALGLRISPLVVGLTVVAFGTSSPELVVSLSAVLRGSGEIALGNVVGSNLCNIGLILGLAALIRPLRVETQLLRIDVPILIAVSVAVPLFFLDGRLSRFEGLLLATALLFYVAATIMLARREPARVEESIEPVIGDPVLGPVPEPSRRPGQDVLLVVAGLGALVAGGHFFVQGATGAARSWGVSEAVIGLTLVAFGTSLPELAASVIAGLRGQGDMAVGNVIGSNLFNLLGILGITATVSPLGRGAVTWIDLGLMAAAPLLLLPLLASEHRFSRGEGAAVLVAYLAYIGWLATG